MARYFISVGGTGQHVALALTRLVRMRVLREDIRLIALDSDNKSKLSELLESPTKSLGQRHPLHDGKVRAPFEMASFGEKTFGQMFIDPDHPAEQDLFECLFNQDEADIPVHRGMFGTPCVGATVFAEGASGPVLKNLLEPIANADQVFICGSVVGGTGAGMIHKLVQDIRKFRDRDLFGIFFLPWFIPPTDAGEGAITPALIARNSAHGLKYFYEHTIPTLTASLLIGYPGTTKSDVLTPLHVRAGDMGEHPSNLHLVGARAVVELPDAVTANKGIKAYYVSHDLDRERWLLDLGWETVGSTPSTLRQRVRALRVQEALLAFFLNPKKRSEFAKSVAQGETLVAELAKSVANNCPDRKQRPGFVDECFARFEELLGEARFCLSWMYAFYEKFLDDKTDRLLVELADPRFDGLKLLQRMWSMSALTADPSKPRRGRDVADHHAEAIYTAGMQP